MNLVDSVFPAPLSPLQEEQGVTCNAWSSHDCHNITESLRLVSTILDLLFVKLM